MSSFKPMPARPRSVAATPKRPLSQTSSPDDLPPRPSSVARFPTMARSRTPNDPQSTKKFKAALSLESRPRSTSRPNLPNGLKVPTSPHKGDGSRSRSTTPLPPASPRTPKKRGQDDTFDFMMESGMDVSRVDPEQALVDFENVDVDLSGEVDEAMLKQLDYGAQDKVLVSIRIRPSDKPQAWSHDTSRRTMKLLPQCTKSTSAPPSEFRFDEILTGSENRPVYNAVARSHVSAAMDGYNAVVFAYGQTASGKTFTLTGDDDQPGIIPRAMKDIFSYIRRTPTREYLLRCSYLEIYNETIHDLLCPPSSSLTQTPINIQGVGSNVYLSPLREEVVTSLKSVKEVLERGYGNRRTASTDWNERSSRSHSVFRVVIESRERGSGSDAEDGRTTPVVPPTPGGSRLQARGGRTVQTSVLSLIDLAGSEKATSDKDRTREGKYINTSLLTLGSVIGTLGENAAKGKTDHVPFRNSKLTRMLQPSLSGNARISVICTINPELSAVSESTSTLLFAQRVKRVQLNAQKKEVVDTEALLQRYKKEIEDLKQRLAEREAQAEAPTRNRRLSAREQLDESKAMSGLNSRIKQLTKLILTSQTVDELKGDESRPASPSKLDFDLSPYQLQQELLLARRQNEIQATQILSLEAALLERPQLPADAPESDKDTLIVEQNKTIRELEIVVRGYEENLGEPLRAVRDDVEKEWMEKLDLEVKKRVEKEIWADELVKHLEKEKQMRQKLEEERKALVAFVTKFDTLGLGSSNILTSRLRQPFSITTNSGPVQHRKRSYSVGLASVPERISKENLKENSPSPIKMQMQLREMGEKDQANLSLLRMMPDESMCLDEEDAEVSFELVVERNGDGMMQMENGRKEKAGAIVRDVFGDKRNILA